MLQRLEYTYSLAIDPDIVSTRPKWDDIASSFKVMGTEGQADTISKDRVGQHDSEWKYKRSIKSRLVLAS